MNPVINLIANLMLSFIVVLSSGLGTASVRHTHPLTVPMDEIQEK